MAWSMFEAGRTLGQTGPRSGRVLRDEAGPRGTRLILEEGVSGGPYVITCRLPDGDRELVYATESSGSAARVFTAMKSDLDSLLRFPPVAATDTVSADRHAELIEQFVRTYR